MKNTYLKSQIKVPIVFRNETLAKEFIIAILVNDVFVLELKAIEKIPPVHEAQLVTYLKLSNKKLGLLFNFNEAVLKNGIRRKINGDLDAKLITAL